jgi:SanA protein
MKQRILDWLRAVWHWITRHKVIMIAALSVVLLSPVIAVVGSYLVINPYEKYILPADTDRHARVGIVLGAGVGPNNKPYKELVARLDVAADALERGKVDRLIVSGDNRFVDYNEPQAMMDYLANERGIDYSKLQPDYAGRSTYESCERASKVFGLHQTIIFSAESHLPRAIFLCRKFGIESYGIASHVEANNSTRREALARVKALYNIYVRGEPTVLGDDITIE